MTTFSIHASGPEDAPAFVFLHGFMGSAADFAPVTELLADRWRCVRIDLPGHGTAALPDRELSLPWLARRLHDEVLAPLNRRSAERPTLVGYSMGGRLALQTTLDHSASLANTVLVSTSPGIVENQAREKRREQDQARAASIQSDFDAFLDAWYQLSLFGDLARSEGHQMMLERRRRNDPQAMAQVVRELSPGRQPSNWHRLGELENTTWIVGAEDPKYAAVGQRLEAEGHRVIVAPGAAHALHVERPAWLSKQLLARQ